MAQNWIMMISELRRYQGVSYKSDITVISGLDPGDRQVLEQRFSGFDPPCLLDSSDGRFVLKGAAYNPMDVMNCLMIRRGYKMQGDPQQRNLPNIHNKDDKFCLIYHLSKECALKRVNTTPDCLGSTVTQRGNSAPPLLTEGPDVTHQRAATQLNKAAATQNKEIKKSKNNIDLIML